MDGDDDRGAKPGGGVSKKVRLFLGREEADHLVLDAGLLHLLHGVAIDEVGLERLAEDAGEEADLLKDAGGARARAEAAVGELLDVGDLDLA